MRQRPKSIYYQRTKEYDRLNLSFKEISAIIGSLEYYSNEIKQDSNNYSYHNLSIVFSNNSESITLSSFKQFFNLKHENENFQNFNLIFISNFHSIKYVDISMNDRIRNFTVRGEDPRKVNALFDEIDKLFIHNRQFLYWVNWSLLITIMISLIAIFVTPYLTMLVFESLSRKMKLKAAISFSIIGGIIISILFLIPTTISFDEFFPGFMIITGKSSWIKEHSDLFTLLGLIPLLISGFFLIRKFRKKIIEYLVAQKLDNNTNENEV